MGSNLSSARRVKSSQGSRRGTCGWITSFFSFLRLTSYGRRNNKKFARDNKMKLALFLFSFLTKMEKPFSVPKNRPVFRVSLKRKTTITNFTFIFGPVAQQ